MAIDWGHPKFKSTPSQYGATNWQALTKVSVSLAQNLTRKKYVRKGNLKVYVNIKRTWTISGLSSAHVCKLSFLYVGSLTKLLAWNIGV